MATRIFKKIDISSFFKQLFFFSASILLISSLIFIVIYSLFSNFKLSDLTDVIRDSYYQYIIIFTSIQAILSTIISLVIAIAASRGLYRQSKFIGRPTILRFINLSFILPAITIILAIIIIYGKNGWINQLTLKLFNYSFESYIYGVSGVVIGHLVFCLPLAVKVLLNCLNSIPQETWRLVDQLNLSSRDTFKIIEWPCMRSYILSLALIIFMLCFSSFSIVLGLGGGPAITTIEMAIYQAIKFDFDLTRAVTLSLIQFVIFITLTILLSKQNKPSFYSIYNKSNYYKRADAKKISSIIFDTISILVLFIFSILPVVAIFINGINAKFFNIIYSSSLWESIKNSLLIATCSGIFTTLLSIGLASGAFYFKYTLNKPKLAQFIVIFSNIRLMIPVFILSTGLFITFNQITNIENIAFYLIILTSSILSLPFAANIVIPISLSFTKQELNLCESLNIKGWNFIKLIFWPKFRKPFSYALALITTISLGDLSITALFNNSNFTTLPFFLYNMMSSYQFEESYAVAFILLTLSFFLFWIIEEFLGGEN